MATTGLTGVGLGLVRLAEADGDPHTWLYANGMVYLATAAGCLTSVVLTYARLVRASEIAVLMTAYLTTMGVVITETADFAPVIGMAAFSLIVLLPGVVYRVRSTYAGAINIVGACIAYLVSMMIRRAIRPDSGLAEGSDLGFKLVVPTVALAVAWSMVRALNRRILEALADSEHARHDLRHTLDRQIAFNDALIRFVPREFLTNLGRGDISEVRLGDSVTRTMSVLFADIYGYTRIVETMPPGSTVPLLNEVFGALEPAIHNHGGFVDSYIGDAIMALFSGSPRDAVAAGVAMLTALRDLNTGRRAAGWAPIAIGIGIHTGPLTLGTIGGPKQFKCSVFGDSVNLAARIEHLTRRYDTPLLVSEETLALIGVEHGFDVRVVDRVRVVGRTTPTTLWEVYDADPESRRAEKQRIAGDHATGVAAFYDRRFAEAVAAFDRCRAVHDDIVVRAYIARCRILLTDPPDAAWDGTETLQSK